MDGRKWLAIPLLLAVGYLGGHMLTGNPRLFMGYAIPFCKLVQVVGLAFAVSRYSFGDRLHTAWLLMTINAAVLLLRDLTIGMVIHLPGLDMSAAWVADARGLSTLAANISSVVATVLLARTWRAAGLELPGTPEVRRRWQLVTIAVAAVIVSIAVYRDVRDLVGGNHASLSMVASDLGDLIAFSLIAPLGQTAFALRGGALFWPWMLLTLSNVMWLTYDLSSSIGALLHVGNLWVNLFRAIALGFGAAAGLAQWSARRPRRQVALDRAA